MTATGTVAWFDLAKQFGFVALSNGYGDTFLPAHVGAEGGWLRLGSGPINLS
jgi:cold shock protein